MVIQAANVEAQRPLVRLMQQPEADVEFEEVKGRPEWQEQIVQAHSDYGGDFVGTKDPRQPQRQERLEPEQRSEAKKNAQGRAKRNRIGRVLDGE